MKKTQLMSSAGSAGAMVAMAMMLAAMPAAAQQGTATASAPRAASGDIASQIEDIVVIGRKRALAEQLQETPLSITAISSTQLQRPTIRDLVDVGHMVPNASLQASSQKGVQNFSIRGMGISGTTVSDEPAVGIFQDGVYWGANQGALGELFDLEGVEILRGPQGTLFGRNVTGGALTVRSARPSQDPSARIALGVSNGIGVDGSVVLNQPISSTLSARIAALHRYNQGLFDDAVHNSSYGETRINLIRPSLKWEPSSAFNVTLLGEYYGNHGDPVAIRGVSPNTIPRGPLTLAEKAGYVSSPKYSVVQPGERGYSNIDVYFGMAEANLEVGPGTLTSITGYRKVKAANLTDYDGFPVDGFLMFAGTNQHQFSEELRYAANVSDWLGFTTGLYYFEQHFNYKESRDLSNHATKVATNSLLDNSSYAAFAEADIKPFTGFTLTVGGRYTHEKKTPEAAPLGSCPFDFSTACVYSTRPAYKGNNFSPKVGLAYQLDENKLLFGSWTQGYRSGGFSLRGTPLGTPYQAETVNAFEAGLKTDWLDNRLRFNLSGYFNKYDNLQRTVLGVDPILGVVQAVFNAADAEIKGVEVELTAIPVTGLTLSGNYGYTDAKYKKFAGVANPGARKFVRVPKSTGSVSADYETRVGDNDRIGFHAGASYTGEYFFDDPNQQSQKSFWLVDATASYTFNDRLTLTAWTRNLTNTKYAHWGSTLGALGQNMFVGDPRTYGLRLSVALN